MGSAGLKWWKGLVTLTLVVSCRDELSEQKPEPNQDLSPVEAEHVPQKESPVFHLGEQVFFIGEQSGAERGVENFEEFVSLAQSDALLRAAGVAMEFVGDEIHLNLSAALVLSFSEVGTRRPVRIHTQGHDLWIAAGRVEDLVVKTGVSGAPSGNVSLLVSQSVGGTFDLTGSAGRDGKDGECPPGFESCLNNQNLRFPQEMLEHEVRFLEEDLGRKSAGEFVDELDFEPLNLWSLLPPSADECPEPQLKDAEHVEQIVGEVALIQKRPQVTWKGEPKGQSAFFSKGGQGEDGQAGGRFELLLAPGGTESVHVQTKGGEAGTSGRNGYVGPAPAPLAEKIEATHEWHHAAVDARLEGRLAGKWESYGYDPDRLTPCLLFVEEVKLSRVHHPRQAAFRRVESVVLAPPKTTAGEDVSWRQHPPAQAGSEGEQVFGQAELSGTGRHWGFEVPVPAVFLYDNSDAVQGQQ